jgi:hypothetical protein
MWRYRLISYHAFFRTLTNFPTMLQRLNDVIVVDSVITFNEIGAAAPNRRRWLLTLQSRVDKAGLSRSDSLQAEVTLETPNAQIKKVSKAQENETGATHRGDGRGAQLRDRSSRCELFENLRRF